jgi:hypothetical protein
VAPALALAFAPAFALVLALAVTAGNWRLLAQSVSERTVLANGRSIDSLFEPLAVLESAKRGWKSGV